MSNKIKTAIIFLICLLFVPSANCQIQNNIPDYLRQKFLKYTENVPWEEIFLHSDREEYIAGEDLWFNIYLIDRKSFKPSLNSRIVYFELLNGENRPIVQKRFSLDNGSGPGRILLPDTLSTGLYTVRAYTSWMKNFAPENCFIKAIKVYNALNARGDEKIKREWDFTSEEYNKDLSAGKETRGVTLKVDNSKQDILELFVNTDSKFQSENSNLFYVFIQTHGNINHISTERIPGPVTKVVVPRSEITSGINQITIFDSSGHPVLERYIYTHRRENNLLVLQTDDSCGVRNKITLDLALNKKLTGTLNSTKLSVSVAPLINDFEIMNIDDYLIFGSEYGSIIRTMPGGNIDEIPSAVIDSILLDVRSNWIKWEQILSGGLPKIKFQKENDDNILSGKLLTNDQQPVQSSERLFLSIPGKMATFQYARTDNEGKFNFHIPSDELVKDLIIMPEDNDAGHKIIIESPFSDQYPKFSLSVGTPSELIAPRISKMSVNHQVQTIFGNHTEGAPMTPKNTAAILQRFYGKPDIELILSDYVSLPVMSEVIFELLPGVSLKKKKSDYEFSITEHIDDGLVVTTPTLMIDGVIIKDASLIVNLDPEIVEKIDVVKGRYEVGKYIFTGIINVITKAGDFTSVPLSDYMMRLRYRVVEPVMSFISPEYSSEERRVSRLPDYRNTLYWNPSVKPDQDGKVSLEFWSSDNKSDYVINIQGITQEGKVISVKKILKVK
jgi:hypothetical protein